MTGRFFCITHKNPGSRFEAVRTLSIDRSADTNRGTPDLAYEKPYLQAVAPAVCK